MNAQDVRQKLKELMVEELNLEGDFKNTAFSVLAGFSFPLGGAN